MSIALCLQANMIVHGFFAIAVDNCNFKAVSGAVSLSIIETVAGVGQRNQTKLCTAFQCADRLGSERSTATSVAGTSA